MDAAYTIAKKYFKSTQKIKLVNLISKISLIGIIVSNTALIVSTSVYDGLKDMVTSILKSTDADIVVRPKCKELSEIETIKEIIQNTVKDNGQIYTIIEGYALAKNLSSSNIVKVRGIDRYDLYLNKISNFVPYKISDKKFLTDNFATIGEGIAVSLNCIQAYKEITLLAINNKKHNSLFGFVNIINRKAIPIGAIFSIDTQKDRLYILVPIKFSRELFHNSYKETFFEIELNNNIAKSDTLRILEENLRQYNCEIELFENRQSLMISAIKMEQTFTKIVFFIILLISIVNIFFCLNAIITAKREDLQILSFIGFTEKQIAQIFLYLGALIAMKAIFISSMISIFILCVQQNFKIVKMGATIGSIDSYPVKIQIADFLFFSILLFVIILLTAFLSIKLQQTQKQNLSYR